MALVSNSTTITKLEATPVTKLQTTEAGGVVRSAIGYLAAASFVGGTAGQWYTFVRLPMRARILGVFITGATTTSGAVKIGLYRTGGGIAIDDACIVASYDMAAEKDKVRVDTAVTALQRSQKISDAFSTAIGTAGATNDVNVDIAATIVTALGSSVAHLLEVEYVLED